MLAAKPHTVPDWGLEAQDLPQGSAPGLSLRPATQHPVPVQSRPAAGYSVPSPGMPRGCPVPVPVLSPEGQGPPA